RWAGDHALARWLLEAPTAGGAPPATLSAGPPALPEASWLVPVRLRDEPVGVFLYGPHSSGEPLSATQRAILDLLANETAAAVANARLFNQVARARREWLQTFDALSDGVFLHDREGRVLRANRALARLVGRSFDQIIARPWFELIPAGPEARMACIAPRPGEPRQAAEYDLTYRDQRTLHVTVSPVVEGEEFCVHVLRDVTEERAMQRQLAQAEKLAAIGEMLSGVAHELNNPLTTIIGFSELLQDASVPESVRADLQRISRQARHSSRIVQSLLAFARQSRLQMTEVDVNALLEQTLELVQPQLESHNIEATLELDPQLPHALADVGQLQQVFLNLITNAQQAMSAAHGHGTLSIRSQALATCLRIAVRDDGPGIPQELLQRVFDPFFTTKEVGEGTGLGLSICYGIIREHGGRIWAESEPGLGATFFVELPIRHAGASAAPVSPPLSLSSRRILIVEEDEDTVALLRRALEPAGHEIVVASDGAQGLEALAEAVASERAPDLVIADLKMGGLDGRGFYEQVRRELPRLGPRWLFIAGDVLEPGHERFLREHRLPHLPRPFGLGEILESVARALL
ncbi:MAG: ATP-binding protein, partial [Anaerolineae bacterium]|nr:ATP-binding protein [Anaerolineae bacterium]